MSRVPVRVRLAAAFAVAMLVVLAAVGAFVHAPVRGNLDETIDAGLHARVADLAQLASRSGSIGGGGVEPEEAFGQVLERDGGVAARYGGARSPALTPAEARSRRSLTLERRVPGVDGTSRIMAVPVRATDLVAVAGTSLEDRDETLAGLVTAFAVAGPVAAGVASLLGWLLAGAALAPMEAMRGRAERVSLDSPGERLPLPRARDEVYRLGSTLNEMLARLEASFERERRFVADASHELRTPLAVLRAEIETALAATGGESPAREALVAALAELDQLAQLAEDLLLVARSADGELPLRPEPVDLGELLEAARLRFSERAAGAGRTVAVDVPDGLRAELDPLRIRQALGNLVDNALRHGEGEIRLAAEAAGGEVTIAVSDGGSGFAADVEGRAFERFARARDARGSGGAGLGLAIVKAIAEAHGGSAAIAGSRVELRIPLSSSSQPAASGLPA